MVRKRVKLCYEELPEPSDKVQRKTDNGTDPQHLPVKMEKSKMKDGITEEKCNSQCNNNHHHHLNLQRINKVPAITHSLCPIEILFDFFAPKLSKCTD